MVLSVNVDDRGLVGGLGDWRGGGRGGGYDVQDYNECDIIVTKVINMVIKYM